MADVLAPTVAPRTRHLAALTRRRRETLIIAISALAAAMLSLPLAQSRWHGPEVAATLAVAATAMFAGQRWGLALVVLTELLLVPSVLPRATFASGDIFAHVTGLLAMLAMVPGFLAMRRASASMVEILGWQRTQRTCRRFHAGLIAASVVAAIVPLVA